jgi:hypothetical protein
LIHADYAVPVPEINKAEAQRAAAEMRLPVGEPEVPAAPLKQGFGCARDYSWLMGELLYVRSRGVWRLRYADPDEDRYGGTVILVGEGLTGDCKTGQIVRVEGHMINPDSTEPRPPYWVRKVRIIRGPVDSDE